VSEFHYWKKGWKKNKGQQCKVCANIDVWAQCKVVTPLNIDLMGNGLSLRM